MPDVLGWRKKFGVLAPSTNTVVEPEFYMMGVPGVTAHISRILMSGFPRDRTNAEAEEQWHQRLGDEMKPTIERVLTCEPDYMVMGMSAPTFRGGVEGNRRWKERMQEYSGGLGMANGAEACERALSLLKVKRIGVLTPYWARTSEHVIRFFNEAGYDVEGHKDLQCPTPVSIAHVTADECRAALLEIDSDRVEAIVQCGTDLNMARLADEADRWLGKPVIAINAAIWWMALRDNEIPDKLYGFGRLLKDF
jgi:maleate isomerase